ncbi:MAG: DUF2147 domain-containing protein [Pseudomonadota bacterium]
MKAVIASLALVAVPAPQNAWAEEIHGYWRVERGDAIVEAGPCRAPMGEGDLCAAVVWYKDDAGEVNTPSAVDARNTEETLQARPICGLPILWGLRARGKDNAFKAGFVYDAFVGETYRVNVRLDGPVLRVRGYLGTPAIGRTERWERPEVPFERCDEDAS